MANFEKDGNGRPTGTCRENASTLIRSRMPASSGEDMKSFLKLAMDKAHSLGLSACGSFDSGGTDFDEVVDVYREIYDESRITLSPALRVTMQCGISAREDLLDAYQKRGIYKAPLWEDKDWGCFLKMGSIKLFADGTLGGHTAWMKNPYCDKPETSGFPVLDIEDLERLIQKAADGGMQVLIHAIGDAGMDAVISAFEKVTSPGNNPLRHGIVHCQITTPELLERMARNKILALVQPVFLSDDLPILESRVGGALASTSYAWNTMHKSGIPVSYSTDAPVSPPDPLLNIEWAILRRNSEDPASESFCPGEKTDIHTALYSYSQASSFANNDENCLGRIAPGYLADLAFLDRDIFSIPPEDIHRAKVIKTLCAGETVYQ